ncbi:MAG: GTP-binding protein [Promethearchaeota archaeon]|nr:MAG: GTP-binding protein [Candidatus Lokiarchaeota archaeon]
MEKMKTFGFKLLVLGAPAVGKTSLIRRFTTGKFSETYSKTLGADFLIKFIDYPDQSMRVLLQIWDLAGDARFRFIRRDYYQEAQGALLVYDITRPNTYQEIRETYENLLSYCGKVPCIIIGNKMDLAEDRKLSLNDGESLANELGFEFYETSAKSAENVEKVFRRISDLIIKENL